MGNYLITITAFKKNIPVMEHELKNIIEWLEHNGVEIEHGAFETSGLYNQLHYHATIKYNGLYRHLTQYGDDVHERRFKIHWMKIKRNLEDVQRSIQYVYKDTGHGKGCHIKQQQILLENYYRHNYHDYK